MTTDEKHGGDPLSQPLLNDGKMTYRRTTANTHLYPVLLPSLYYTANPNGRKILSLAVFAATSPP